MSKHGVFCSKKPISLLQIEQDEGSFTCFSDPVRFSLITETILGITSPALFT